MTAAALSPDSPGSLAGRLSVRPGQARPLAGSRPVLGGAVLQRLVQGLAPAQLPARLAAVFSLCGVAHRITATRAVRAAMGEPEPVDAAERAAWQAEDQLLQLWTAREHLQRLALDLPLRLPVAGVAADGAWLRGHPLARLPADAETGAAAVRQIQDQGFLPWLEATVLGGPVVGWLDAWRHETAANDATDASTDAAGSSDSPLLAWCDGRPQPALRWLHGAAGPGRALTLPCRPLPAVALSPAGLSAIARALDDDAFAQRPLHDGQPAETGCWTRLGLSDDRARPHNAWMRWQYRLAELVSLAQPGGPPVLRGGAVALGDGEGLAWTEMSRGVLMHRVRLSRLGGQAVVDSCRVLAPTEWNFHPDGGLARALAAPGLTMPVVQAAVAALDPCVEVDLAPADGACDA